MDTEKVTHFGQLQVWQKGMALAQAVYRLTQTFPSEERFGLVAQMRRAAVSVPSNIAEGQARRGTREFLAFLSHAAGSLAELETQLILTERLGFATNGGAAGAVELVHEVQKMIAAMRQSLQKRLTRSSLATRHSPLATNHSPLSNHERHSPLATCHYPLARLANSRRVFRAPLVRRMDAFAARKSCLCSGDLQVGRFG